jgi:hypothetical protein
MAAVSVTRLTQHAPVFRLELLLFSCSPTPPGTSPVGGKLTFAEAVVNRGVAPIPDLLSSRRGTGRFGRGSSELGSIATEWAAILQGCYVALRVPFASPV